MKVLVLACVVTVASAAYTYVDDHIDINDIDAHSEQVKSYLLCQLDKGPCTPSMMSFRKHSEELVHTACAKCSPVVKHIGEEFFKTATRMFPELIKEFQQKYDPQGNDYKAFIAEMNKYQK